MRYPKTHIIVVFTKVRKSLTLSRKEMEKTFNTQILTLLHGIKNRWIVMPDLDLFGNNEGKSVIKNFVDELKEKIMEIGDNENAGKKTSNREVPRGVGEPSRTIGWREKVSYASACVCIIVVVIIIIIIIIKKS